MNNDDLDLSLYYNSDRIDDFLTLYTETRNSFSEVDDMLYNTMINLYQCKGIDDICNHSSAIDLSMPEKMVIQCREKGQNILDRVNYVKEEIAKYVGDKPSSNNNTDTNKNDDSNEKPDNEARDADELTPVLYGPAPVPTATVRPTLQPVLYGPAPVPTATLNPIQPVLYGPAPVPTATLNPIQPVLYGPAPVPTATLNPIQPVLYGPAPVPTATLNPIQPVLYGPAPVPTATLNPIQPALYGPVPVPNDNETIVIPLPSVIPTPSVAPTPQQDSDQQYKIYNPIGGQGSSDESVNPYTAVPDTNPNVEYSSIPDTAVGMDFDIDKLKAPLAAGLAGGVLSLEAARRARRNSSDDEEELEEFEEEKK